MNDTAKHPTEEPVSIGTPAAPAFVRRKGVFIGLMILFVIWMSALVAMSIQLHDRR